MENNLKEAARLFLRQNNIRVIGDPENTELLLNTLTSAVYQGSVELSLEALEHVYLVTTDEADPRSASFISDYYHPYNKVWQTISNIVQPERAEAMLAAVLKKLDKMKKSQAFEKVVACRLAAFLNLYLDRQRLFDDKPFDKTLIPRLAKEIKSLDLPEGDIIIASYRECLERANPILMLEFLSGGIDLNPKIVKEETMFDFPMCNLTLMMFAAGYPVKQANSGHFRGSAVVFFEMKKHIKEFPFLKSGFPEDAAYEIQDVSDQTTREKWLGLQDIDGGGAMKIKYFSIFDLLDKINIMVERLKG